MYIHMLCLVGCGAIVHVGPVRISGRTFYSAFTAICIQFRLVYSLLVAVTFLSLVPVNLQLLCSGNKNDKLEF